MSNLIVKNLSEVVGVEIVGINLSKLGINDIAYLRDLLLKKQVIVFREQQLLPEELPSIISKFGDLYIHDGEKKFNNNPIIGFVHADKHRRYAEGIVTHADRTYHQTPPRLSMLMVTEIPIAGGDTLFINVIEAYKDLTCDMKQILDDKIAVHNPHFVGTGTTHPVIKIKPETKEKFIYVNKGFTKNIIDTESTVLEELLSHIELDKYKCRVVWNKGDVTLWDNYGIQHKAIYDYYPETRTGYRVLTTNMY
jgi:taurine dioxygenase